MLVDSHCHLVSLPPDERAGALDAARQRGVGGFLVPATELSEAEATLELCHQHPDVWCALGVHPHQAASWQAGDEQRLADLAGDSKVVAIGECGLDFHYDFAPREVQEQVMRAQWRVALALDLPVVVHNRESDEVMSAVFREDEFAALQADFHSFAGSPPMAQELLGRGAYLGVTGMVTFKAADNIRQILTLIPDEQLLVETDSPYLAPVPYRGQPNRPAYVVEVAARVALERGRSTADVAALTTANFFRLFRRAAGSR